MQKSDAESVYKMIDNALIATYRRNGVAMSSEAHNIISDVQTQLRQAADLLSLLIHGWEKGTTMAKRVQEGPTGCPRLLIMGHGRHGKDTFAEMLGLPFESSSMAACRECVWPVMGWQYTSIEECFNDRVNRRDEWKRLISEYNCEDPTRLASAIYSRCDVYVGIRSRVEFEAICSRFNPLVIWVDRSSHLPTDATLDMTADEAHLYVDNNGGLHSLRLQAGVIRAVLGVTHASL